MKKLLSVLLIFPLFIGVNNPTSLDTGGTQDQSSITTASVSPTANSLLVLIVGSVNNPSRTHATPTDGLTGTGTWTSINTATLGFGHISAWYAIAGSAPGSGTVSQGLSGGAFRQAWILAQVTGFDRGTVIRESNTGTGTASTLSISLTDLIDGTMSVGVILSIGDSDGITPGSGETELVEVTSGGSNESRLQFQYGDGTNDTAVNWSALNTTGNSAIAFEINSDPGISMSMLKVRILARSDG